MRSMQRPDQSLKLRGDMWHYVRRVPKAALAKEGREQICQSLETDSRKVARQRRGVCSAAADQR